MYLVHDRADREAVGALQAELERRGHVVMLPLGEGSEAEAREVHEASMVLSDAVIIFYGDHLGALGADEALRHREGTGLGTQRAVPGQGGLGRRAGHAPQGDVRDRRGPGPRRRPRGFVAVALEPFLAQLASVATGR